MQDFADQLQANMRNMFGTDPDNADYTSIVSDRHYARLEGLVADAAAKGAKVMQAAKPSDRLEIQAQISADHPDGCHARHDHHEEEIFGPLLPVMGYKDAGEPVAYINKEHYWNKWNRKINGLEDFEWQVETQFGKVQGHS